MHKIKNTFKTILLLALAIGCKNADQELKQPKETNKEKPNIIFIYLDDLGYGDVSAYGAEHLNTPNFDKLAKGGVTFTNGYASSATCTPSRYALLTGIYPWRNKNAKILPGTAPLLIDTAQVTIAKMLKEQGYYTGIVGKWHLGLGLGNVDWNSNISPGPNEVGFDYSYIMAATQDRVPTVYIRNGLVEGLDKDDPIQVDYDKNFEGEPTAISHPEMLKMKWHHGHNNSIVNGIPRIGFMKGGEKAKWVDEVMAYEFLKEAQHFVATKKDEPFFLYYALQQPHVPRTPAAEFVGKSGMGPRGDVILEADWCVGELLKTLEEEGLDKNTLIVFSSDNGPVLNDGYYDEAVEKVGEHDPAGGLRGGKYSLYQAGTRVPFISYWPGTIRPGTSDALISQIDLFSSVARVAGSNATTEDSKELSDVLLGKSQDGRKNLIIEATSRTALRSENWMMIPPNEGRKLIPTVKIENGNDESYQLFNLQNDLGEKNNLANEQPEKLQELIQIYTSIVKTEPSEVQ